MDNCINGRIISEIRRQTCKFSDLPVEFSAPRQYSVTTRFRCALDLHFTLSSSYSETSMARMYRGSVISGVRYICCLRRNVNTEDSGLLGQTTSLPYV